MFCLVLFLNHINVLTASVGLTPFSPFKGTTHAYLLKISIALNKKLISLLNLLINRIPAKSTP